MTTQGTPESRRIKRLLLKLLLCASATAGIAWAIVTLDPDTGQVAEAEADVWNLGLFERSNTQKFATSLKRLGHEPPRSYDLNGNKVFFSVRSTDKRPMELVEEYQRVFTEERLNTEPHGYERRPTRRFRQLLGGQVVPLSVTRSSVVMGGFTTPDSPSSAEEWESMEDRYVQAYENGEIDSHDVFTGYRHIQADWNPTKRKTFVTASWSDEEFDMRRLSGAKTDRVPEEKIVPKCQACTRLIRWETEENDVPYTLNVYLAELDAANSAAFYQRRLAEDGWKLTGRSGQRDEAGKVRMMEFTRGGSEKLQMTIRPVDATHSRITAVHMDE
jgi:hypothetical protein